MEVGNKIILKKFKINTVHEWFKLLFMGDLHVGQKCCDEDAINNMARWVGEQDPTEYGVIITGDIIENYIIGSKSSAFEMAHPDPEDQLDVALELLEPMKAHILHMVDGNHEDRTKKSAGIRIIKRLAKELGVSYTPYRAGVSLQFTNGRKKQDYTCFVRHGAGSIPKTVAGRYTKLSKVGDGVDADIYAMGHVHHKLAFPKIVWKQSPRGYVKKKVMYVCNGAYLVDPEYAVRADYETTEPGVAKVHISTLEHNIHCTV